MITLRQYSNFKGIIRVYFIDGYEVDKMMLSMVLCLIFCCKFDINT